MAKMMVVGDTRTMIFVHVQRDWWNRRVGYVDIIKMRSIANCTLFCKKKSWLKLDLIKLWPKDNTCKKDSYRSRSGQNTLTWGRRMIFRKTEQNWPTWKIATNSNVFCVLPTSIHCFGWKIDNFSFSVAFAFLKFSKLSRIFQILDHGTEWYATAAIQLCQHVKGWPEELIATNHCARKQ